MVSLLSCLRVALVCTGLACYGSVLAAESELDVAATVAQLLKQGDTAIASYMPESGLDTADTFSELYFDVFEASGLEIAVGINSSQRKSELESLFASVIGKASSESSPEALQQAWRDLRTELLVTGETLAQNQTSGFWSMLLQSFLILLREGFEAMLVVTALVTYLKRQNAHQQLPVIYYSVGLALLASLLTAWLLQSVFDITGGATQEALEGVTMLVAAAVLFYVSFWLISKSEASRWQSWVEGQINKALAGGSLFTLGLAAFLAVYREGAETVLFYQALLYQSSSYADNTPLFLNLVDSKTMALMLGFVLAAASLFVVYRVMRSASQKLPIGLFFSVTAGLLYYLSITFAGNGILELQEAGWVGITSIDWLPRISWLGLYPTVETASAQLLLLMPLPIAFVWWRRQRRQASLMSNMAQS